ncbi:hypothetical protein [Bartonella sp. AD328YNZD]|uniref:hypothetical protein n=1 Tax=Bartonella sp. AD328YNZD TaxID=3243464 RepID=UPI0035D1207B
MEIDESLEWLLRSQKLTILQAALLIAGLNPLVCKFPGEYSPEDSDIYEGEERVPFDKIALFRAVYNEIVRVVEEGKLRVEWYYHRDFWGGRWHENPIVQDSSVSLDNLKEWLLLCGKRPKVFFPEDDSRDVKDQKYAFQDPTHPRYAPKLAAIVAAWEAVSEAEGGKTVKGTLIKWLQQNADQYDLRNKKNGKLKEDVIEQLASIANWEPTGGAPKTPAN